MAGATGLEAATSCVTPGGSGFLRRWFVRVGDGFLRLFHLHVRQMNLRHGEGFAPQFAHRGSSAGRQRDIACWLPSYGACELGVGWSHGILLDA